MKTLLAFLLLLFALPAKADVFPPAGWTLSFDESFTTGTDPDPARWNQNWFGAAGEVTRPINASENGAYGPGQTTVAGGILKLTSKATPITINGVTYPYRTGFVASYDNSPTTPGMHYETPPFYLEFRAFVPASGGQIANWPALWINGNNWPADTEVDIFEGLSGNATCNLHASGLNRQGTVAGTWTGAWHTFGVLYAPPRVQVVWDRSVVCMDVTNAAISQAAHYILATNGLGSLGGPVSIGSILKVDYIRVWKS